MHIAEIGLIHADQEVVFLVIIVLELPGGLAGAVDPMLRQLAPCRGIDRIADLLGAGRRGLNVEPGFQPRLFHQIFHHEFSHWAAADIAVADKKYPRHLCAPILFR